MTLRAQTVSLDSVQCLCRDHIIIQRHSEVYLYMCVLTKRLCLKFLCEELNIWGVMVQENKELR